MKQITKQTIKRWKKVGAVLPEIDYSMNTRYYRAVDKGETIGASVHPLVAIKFMTATSVLWSVDL